MQGGIARIAELDRRLFLRRGAAAAGLDEDREAGAPQLAARFGFGSALFKVLPVGIAHRALELPRRITAVVGRAGGCLVRKRILRNQVSPSQLDALDAEL